MGADVSGVASELVDEDTSLLRAGLVAGDPQAHQEVCTRYGRDLHRFLASRLGDDDLVRFLANEGVKDLRIDDAELSESWWGYDASLVDGGEVTETLGENEECG